MTNATATPDTTKEAIAFRDIEAAAQRLQDHAIVTPLLESPFLNELAGRRVLVKAECLQKTGSFKFRGAWSAVSALDERGRRQGVLAYSSGNHAQGVALAAKIAGVQAVILMPQDAPKLKLENTRAYGAEVVLYDRQGGEDRIRIGEELAQERGLQLIKPYDNPYVMAGQGTCGLEIAQQTASLGVTAAEVLVCCGGGGLTSGVALALESAAPGLQVMPVEPEGYDDVVRSLETGRLESISATPASICDAIVTPSAGNLTWPIIHRLCKKGVKVSDADALNAMREAIRRLKIVAEPGGAVALAAALYHGDQLNSDTVVCIVSGANTDEEMMIRALGSNEKTATDNR